MGRASRLAGRGGGGVIGGRVTLLVDPDALAHLARGRRSVLVSGTNGKTTTTRFLAAALATAGPTATNSGGANLPFGLVAALSSAPPGGLAALEVDEAYLGPVAAAVQPEVVCLLNLSRDQLDRINEVRLLAGRWRQALEAVAPAPADARGPTVVANADDPMVVWAASGAARIVWVGAGLSWRLDATGCPRCEGRIQFTDTDWSCGDCGLARPEAEVTVDDVVLTVRAGRRHPFTLSLPGQCNRSNAAVAATAASLLGVDEAQALAAMEPVADVTGRYGVVRVGGVPARLLLSKNPAGWMEIFDFLRPPPSPVVVAINARIADGRDPSWLWDVPFERLAGRQVVATGERCRDLAVRLRYAEVDHVMVEDPVAAVAEARRFGDASQPVDVVANYTSFQGLRRVAADA
ncbi:MAG: MurT ligase domain-containing protein [Acidimicrobiales bacterium]